MSFWFSLLLWQVRFSGARVYQWGVGYRSHLAPGFVSLGRYVFSSPPDCPHVGVHTPGPHSPSCSLSARTWPHFPYEVATGAAESI